jgi:hypothetical protein
MLTIHLTLVALLATFSAAAEPAWETTIPAISSPSPPTLDVDPLIPLIPAETDHLFRRAKTGPNLGGHLACHDANFTGACAYYVEPRGECHYYLFKHWDKYTSIGPDKGQFCYFYERGDCYGDGIQLEWPGTRNLRGRRFDNRVKSWKCWVKDW